MQTLGPFVLYQRLGAGATAEVHLAAGPNARGAELLALKVMLQALADGPNSREIFLKEARTSALLRHKHVVEIYEVGEVEGRPFIAMELVRGWSLSLLLKKMKETGESFTLDEACEVVRQGALGLHYIHEVRGPQGQALGLIHRDISPQNVILSEEGVVKVVDFGLAKATAEATHTRGLKGKIRYMAPEQLKGEGLDRRVDVFGLGAILWELVCGQPLHPGPGEAEVFQQAFFNPQPHPDEVKRGLPRAVVEVLQTAVAREKPRRFPDAAALAQALGPLVGVDVTSRLAARVQRHFERLPRSRAELEGPVAPGRPAARPPAHLPAPPGKVELLGADFNEITEPALRPAELTAKTGVREGERTTMETATLPPDLELPAQTLKLDAAAPALARTLVQPARARGPFRWVGILVGVSLVVGGFALSRTLFPARAVVEELPPPPPPKWKSEIADEPELPLSPPQVATAASEVPKKEKDKLSGKAPKKGGKGKVRFITSEPAEVFIGKRRYGLSNEPLVLPSGRHRVELVVPGGEKSASIEVDVLAGTSSDLRVALER